MGKNICKLDFPSGPVVKNPLANAGDTGSIPGPERFHMPRGKLTLISQLLSPCSKVHESQLLSQCTKLPKPEHSSFIDYAKAFDCVDHNKLWKILKEVGIPDPLTCLLRSLYAGQKATVRTGHGTKDWFQIGKGVRQGCILSPCLFNLYAEYIMRNAGLEEAQAGVKIAGRNINNLRYANVTTLMAESEEEPLDESETLE